MDGEVKDLVVTQTQGSIKRIECFSKQAVTRTQALKSTYAYLNLIKQFKIQQLEKSYNNEVYAYFNLKNLNTFSAIYNFFTSVV